MRKYLLAGLVLIAIYVMAIFITIQITQQPELWFAVLPALLLFVPMLFIYLFVAVSTANSDRLVGLDDAAFALDGQLLGQGQKQIALLRDRFNLIYPNTKSIGAISCVFENVPLTIYSYKQVAEGEKHQVTFAYATYVQEPVAAPSVMICRRNFMFRLKAMVRSELRREIPLDGSMLAAKFSKRFAVLAEPENEDAIRSFLTDERMRQLLKLRGDVSLEISLGELLLVRQWGFVAALQQGFSSLRKIEAKMMVKMADEAIAVLKSVSAKPG